MRPIVTDDLITPTLDVYQFHRFFFHLSCFSPPPYMSPFVPTNYLLWHLVEQGLIIGWNLKIIKDIK